MFAELRITETLFSVGGQGGFSSLHHLLPHPPLAGRLIKFRVFEWAVCVLEDKAEQLHNRPHNNDLTGEEEEEGDDEERACL